MKDFSERSAFITGITGQDGSYLCELLLSKGYRVHGLVRQTSNTHWDNISHLSPQVSDDQKIKDSFNGPILHYGDMSDSGGLSILLAKIAPDEIYNLAAQSNVKVSFDQPEYTSLITGLGALRILEAVRTGKLNSRVYQASSSEMFGRAPSPQNEESKCFPRSPYGVAKLFAHSATVNYREAYGMYASSGILFNHESPRRRPIFVTRKVTLGIAKILAKQAETITMGTLSAHRDWGHAKEYVVAMWKMLQQDEPDDFVIATGISRSVKDLLEVAFGLVGLNWEKYVVLEEKMRRPSEIENLKGDSSKAKKVLGWSPIVTFEELITEMLEHDLREVGLDPQKYINLP